MRLRKAETKSLTGGAGIGPLNATALAAAVGRAETFGRGRDLAACWGWCRMAPDADVLQEDRDARISILAGAVLRDRMR